MRRKFNVDFLVLCAKEIYFRNIVDGEKLGARTLHIIVEFPLCEAIRSECVNTAIGLAELVVEERADNALRKVLPDVADLLADLIPNVGHIPALHRAFEGNENRRRAGNCIALDVVETGSLLEFLLHPIRDLLERVRDIGTGPKDL